MSLKVTITIDDSSQIILPLEVNQYLSLRKYDWLKVKLEPHAIVLVPPKALEEETIEDRSYSCRYTY